MKIKKIDKNSLLVVLSPGETDHLGFHPETMREFIRTRIIAAKIYEAVCNYVNLPSYMGKIHIRISFSKNETVIFFSPVKKYRILGLCANMVFVFENTNDVIDYLKCFSEENKGVYSSLYKLRGKYYLIAEVPYKFIHSFLRRTTEFSNFYGKSPAMHKKISEHGELIFEDKVLSSLY